MTAAANNRADLDNMAMHSSIKAETPSEKRYAVNQFGQSHRLARLNGRFDAPAIG